MSERRRSAVALSSRAHAFSVEALIGSNKKRKLRDWEPPRGLDLSMESLSPDDGQLPDPEDPAQCLDLHAGVQRGVPTRILQNFSSEVSSSFVSVKSLYLGTIWQWGKTFFSS